MFVPGAHAQNVRTIFLCAMPIKFPTRPTLCSAMLGTGAPNVSRKLSPTRISANLHFRSATHAADAAPLAEQLHLKPVAIPLSKVDDLIAAIRSDKAANILVVWHGLTLPKILRALGAPEITPIGHMEYDRFFILTLDGDNKNSQPRFTSLRYCDSAK